MYQWGRKDAIPGADGSTITQATENNNNNNNNANTIPIYGANGNTLTEDANGYKKVNITAIIGGEPNTAEYTVKNPLTFICNTIEPRDWYTNNKNYQDNTLWDSNKTVSDPCPHGWKVPTDGTWGDFSEITFLLSGTEYTVSNGRSFSNMVWYPASGFRHYNGGVLHIVGSGGYCWSASGNNVNSMSLVYRTNNVHPSLIYHRAYGFPVRCVQE